jgi:hypothetical protein
MKPKTTIKLPTYSCELVVTVVDSVMEEADRLYKKHKIADNFGAEAEGALVMIGIERYYLLFHKDFLTHNNIAHELFHAAVRVTEDRDVTDEEAQAWLAGHLTAEIYKFLEKKKLQVKHG